VPFLRSRSERLVIPRDPAMAMMMMGAIRHGQHHTPSAAALRGGATYSRVSTNDADQHHDDLEEEMLEAEKLAVWISEAMAQVAALNQYAVICIVLSGFAFTGLVSLDRATLERDASLRIGSAHIGKALIFAMCLSIASCIGTGLHATLMFTLCSIYGATAVSHGDKAGYDRFMKNTGFVRVWGFRTFKASIVSMAFSIMFILLSKLPVFDACLVIIPGIALSACTTYQAQHVISNAGHLFRPAAMKAQSNAKLLQQDDEESAASWEESSGAGSVREVSVGM